MVKTTKPTGSPQRTLIEPGIYRRGDKYEIRVPYRDAAGQRRYRWTTIHHTNRIREVRALLRQARAAGDRGEMAAIDGSKLTVAEFLTKHFLPYLLNERVKRANTLSRATYIQYRRYATQKVIPNIGHLRVEKVSSGDIEILLNSLRDDGRHPRAGLGRHRDRPEYVYAEIALRRQGGQTYQAIAEALRAAYPDVCAALTKNAVAAICHRGRAAEATPAVIAEGGLAVSTVENVWNMLRTAWRYGIKHELIPRHRAHVMPEAEPPRRAKNQRPATVTTWTPNQYANFFDWLPDRRPDTWPAFYYASTSGDRKSGDLGLRWDDIDLDAGIVDTTRFVKYLGEPGERVVIEDWGKETPGNRIWLDPRTVEVLRAHKARQAERLLARPDRHVCLTDQRDCPLPGYHDRGLVFPQRDGNYYNPNAFLTRFQDAIRAYNREHPNDPLPVIHIHALRHGWSTTARAEGIDDVIRMDRLDQKTVKVNRAYTQATDPARKAAARAVSDALFAQSTQLGPLGS